ncbi:peptidoglycan recognition protein family protein [Nitratireductor sp. CH_MIT9313-5]|jgi:hypothetical protein|uniref:peptidoglycan recognition protein family protein n=1 Tax=Nitratireductor sp. CH_MIT9313-5 TaxID=3107764 RepID=UPI00300BDF3C
MTIPPDWMPDVPMERIICHWTGGTHHACEADCRCYHILIEGDGKLVRGKASIERNSGEAKRGYAAHTRNCNSGSIGVALCGMKGARQQPFRSGRYPLKQAQWNKLVRVCAELSQRYRIPISPETLLTHAEVQGNLGIAQKGKWDISRLPFDKSVKGAGACGERLREEVQALLDRGGVLIDPVSRESPIALYARKIGEAMGKALAAGLKTALREIMKRIT